MGFKAAVDDQIAEVFRGGDMSRNILELSSLFNHTSIKNVFKKIRINFDSLYSKKAFLHWFLRDGMEKEEF